MTDIAEQLRRVVFRDPICVSLESKLIEAMAAITAKNDAVRIATSESVSKHDKAAARCIVVVEDEKVVGLLTAEDMLRFAVQQLPVERLTVGEFLGERPVTARESSLTDLAAVLSLFEQHQLSYLPILDEQDCLVGLISHESLLKGVSATPPSASSHEQLQAAFGDRQQAETTLQNLIEGTAAATGEDFFPTLVRHIALALEVSHVFVSELCGDELHVLARWEKGALAMPFTYPWANTPCEQVLQDGHFYCETLAQQLFPEDLDLVAMGAESYLGIVLLDREDHPIGNLCLLNERPIQNLALAEKIISVFAARAAAELERERATRALEQLNQDLEARVAERTAALQASEERWQLAVMGTNDAIWDWDFKSNQKYYSQRWKAMRGFREDEIGNSPEECSKRIHPEDYAVTYAALAAHLAGETDFFAAEYRTQCQDDSYLWVSVRGQALRDASGQAIRLIVSETDITQRKQMELALQESQAQFQHMTENVPGMIYRYVLHPDGTDELTYVSAQIRKIFELEPEAAVQNSAQVWERIHPDDIARLRDAIRVSADRLQPFTSAYRLCLPGKRLRWVQNMSHVERLANGDVVWDGIAVDISDRKTAEQELILKQNHLKALLNNIPHMAWIKDEHSRFIAVNQPFAEAAGEPAETLVGKTDYDFWPAELAQAYRDDDFQVLQSGQRKVVEEKSPRSDDAVRWIETTKTPFCDAQGELAGTVGIAVDITDRKQTEQRLKALSERLELAIQSAKIGIWEFDFLNNCLSWDERMFAIYGLESTSFDGVFQDWERRVHPDDLAQALDDPSSEKELYDMEFRIIRPDGEIRWIMAFAFKQRNEKGSLSRAIGVNLDITEHKQSEQQLRRLSERLELALKGAQVGIWEWNSSDYQLIWDERMFSLYGVDPEDFSGQYSEWLQRLHPEDRARMENQEKAHLQEQGYATSEFRIVHPDGTVRFIYSHVSTQRNQQGDVTKMIGLNMDITERKKTEQALQESQELIQKIADASPNILYVYDIQETRNIYVNHEIAATLGYTPEVIQSMGAKIFELLMHPDEFSQIPAYYERINQAQDDDILEYEYRMRHANGEWRWLLSRDTVFRRDATGQVKQTVGAAQDITDRKQAELALEQELRRRNAIFNTSSDGIHILDLSGNLIEANDSFARMLGYTQEEVRRLNVNDWDAKYTREEIRAKLDTPPQQLSNAAVVDKTLHRRKDGSIFPVEISICSMEWNGMMSFICIARDVSERKQAEAKLQRTNAELLRATRLKDEFLANMSHELRTPLNSILGFSEALESQILGPLDEKQIQALKTIERSGNHLLKLINDILDVAKIEAGKIELRKQWQDMPDLCNSAAVFVKQQALKKNIRLTVDIPNNLPKALIDERRILQVLINLLNNAVKFTPKGGRVTLEASYFDQSRDDAEPQFAKTQAGFDSSKEQALLEENDNEPEELSRGFEITISDTGIGISPDDISKLFKPFVQIDSALNRKYEGTGLGLALVKRIVELHGGTVDLSSEVGVGSRFAIKLPFDADSQDLAELNAISAETQEPQKSPLVDSKQLPLILLAEDNESNASMIVSYFEFYGFRLIVAKDGIEAIELAKMHHPSLILMDIQMPRMNGIEAMERIRQDAQMRDTPMIALTALAMKGDEERFLEAGANAYLSKPVKLKQLKQLVSQLLESID